ncbi:MAG: phage shock protein operon transcriptional activator [Gammaproteobacteria bacterium]|nr:phage shock protein operon transcriptional activator [Gammaproteobacteria bacterium]
MSKEQQQRTLGESPAFLRILEEVSQVAPLEKPVLVVGERGTGKELIAARLHFLSNRWEGHFLKMNCAAISDSLLESELFGHEAGAFTGASKTHHGRFERAHGGTLFLDELASTSPLVQEKLLRIIEYGEYERVGGNKTLYCDVRLIAATNRDLPSLAESGKFRNDLLDRLAFDVLTLPPLRERGADIMLLAEHFALGMTNELNREYFPGFSAEVKQALESYAWPGNVRELKNVIERCVYRNDEDNEIQEVLFDPFDSPFRPLDQPNEAKPPNPAELPLDLKKAVQDFEIDLLNRSLTEAKHNQRKAAELLKLTYHQLRGYLKKYELLKND